MVFLVIISSGASFSHSLIPFVCPTVIFSLFHLLTCMIFLYRKMQVSGATDLASKGQGVSDSSTVQVKGETDDSLQLDTKVRCLCGNALQTESMIKVYQTIPFMHFFS